MPTVNDSSLISFATWRRVVLGAGAGVVFGVVLTGFLLLTGALQMTSGSVPASRVLAESLTGACAQLVPWLLLWLIVLPALLRVPIGQPWLALAIYVALAVWLVPLAIGVTELSPSQLVAIGIFAMVSGLPVVRAADTWLVASFIAALHIITVSIVGLPFGGSGGYGLFDSTLTGDVLLTGGTMGPVFGLFGMLGMLWVAGSLLQHQAVVFADAARMARSRRDALMDFGIGLVVSAAGVSLMFMAMLVMRQSRIAAVAPSLGALSASLGTMLPGAIAGAFLYGYVLASVIMLAVRRAWIAAMVTTAVAVGVHLMAPGTNAHTAAGAGAATLAGVAAFLATGRLWMPVALGYGWLLFEGPIFGFASGGLPAHQSWFRQETLQFTAWSGGIIGPDASVAGIIAKLLMTAAVIWLSGPGTWRLGRRRTRHQERGTRDVG